MREGRRRAARRGSLAACASAAAALSWMPGALAQSTAPGPAIGGPQSVGAQLARDSAVVRLPATFSTPAPAVSTVDAIEASKDWLQREHGLSLGAFYATLFQYATRSPNSNAAASGAARLYGEWTLVNRGETDTGSLVFKVEYRHRIGTPIAPQLLGPGFGYAGLTAVVFSDVGWMLSNLYWSQKLLNNRIGVVAGIVDTTDYVDVFGLFNIWTDFNNLGFTNMATMPAPNQGLGAAVRVNITPNLYVLGGMADANGDPTNPWRTMQKTFETSEFFRHIEFGWIGSWENRFTDNIHVTAWQSDARDSIGIKGGSGVTLSASRLLNDRWIPIARLGFANGGAVLQERQASVALGYRLNDNNDFIGAGLTWGQPPVALTNGRREHQYAAEAYYRIQILPRVEFTPALQVIVNPVLDPSADTTWVIAARLRISL